MKRVDTAPSAKRARSKKVAWGSEYRLGDIATVQQGYTFSPEHQGQSVGKWQYVKVGDLSAHGNSKYLDRTFNCVDDDVVVKIGAVPFLAGSIVFPRVGAALKNNNKRILSRASLTDDNVIVVTVIDNKACDAEYLYYWFDAQDLRRFCNDGTVPVINGKNLKRALVRLPQICTQRDTAELLSTWDTAIQKTEQMIAAKEQQHRALSSRLLFGLTRFKKHGVSKAKPLHWFSTSNAWSVVEIGKVAREISAVNDTGGNLPVLSCTKYDGLVDSLEYFKKQVFSHDTAKYKLVRRGQFAYATNHIEEGSIGYQDVAPMGLVSPIYTVFEADTSRVDNGYLYKLLKTERLRQIFAASTSASVNRRGSLRWKDFARIHIPLPPLDEQRAIRNVLDTGKREIDLLKSEVAAFKTQKRGLMQKLLTGEWRLPLPEQEVV